MGGHIFSRTDGPASRPYELSFEVHSHVLGTEVESNTDGAGQAYPQLILAKGWAC